MTQMELEQERQRRRRPLIGRRRAGSGLATSQEEGLVRRSQPRDGLANVQSRARGLGWFSIGLGVAQLVAPGLLSQLVLGHDDRRKRLIMRALGVRELAAGLGILSSPRAAGWLYARVAGDLMDLALLGASFNSRRLSNTKVALSAAAVLGVTALDLRTGRDIGVVKGAQMNPFDVEKSIVINCSTDAAYRYWRNFQNLPSFMESIEAVDVRDERRSHWWVKSPGGKTLEWDAELTEDRPTELIAWRTLPNAAVENSGEVRFRSLPGNRGTEVKVRVKYEAPSSAMLRTVGKLLDKGLEFQVYRDLRRFKQILEVGEVVHSDASIHDGPHPAQPSRNGGAR
ncbi:MAG TPA: SRPBCC family protein [Polyangia bacterium]